MFDGVRFPNGGPSISHLLYADDAMVMGEWSQFNFKALKRILRVFHLCSGLRINLHKSSLFGVGKSTEEVTLCANGLGCRPGTTPFKYLGILVGANMNCISNWDPVVEVFKKRLSSWKASVLSTAGRVILIKSVLESLPTYYFSLYKAPVAVVNKLESIVKRFFWGGSDEKNKIHWVAWDKVTKSKKDGGLGLSKLEECNNALVLKWLWRYRTENDALWRKVIDAVHGSKRRWETFHCSSRFPGTWTRLVKFGYQLRTQGISFINMIRGVVGNDTTVKFWIDPWLTSEPLKRVFPTLFRLEANKWCTVADRINVDNRYCAIQWRWKKYPATILEVKELIECHRLVSAVHLNGNEDSWAWNQGSSDGYSVKDARKWLKGNNSSDGNIVFNWCKWIPNKCNIFMWRASLDRIPTQSALRRRNILVGDGLCVFCGETEENADHLFSGCRVACGVWNAIANWCKIPPFFVFSTNDVIKLVTYLGGSEAKKEIIYGVLIVSCWIIWKARNDKIFNGKNTNVVQIVSDIKSMGYLWYRSRHKEGSIDWKNWCNFSVPMM
ncbi:reverse transcriptase domain, Reverse transcriptase zinc-binding domain protein [Artemisia annua]|uniref:Reverse transcriptase domain, Reverse transcriptase zinc-binding domain protein n=1 Tax=Artemisia annua TaxID=35608 RepID=A0A2U1QK92_ARTAN|nr:reverse transcriptase domain, Reverse transcriptase zinc-binding domain protein [Artemisia annua]